MLVIPKLATIHLERHRARQDEERRLLGAAWQDYGLVFASSVGTPLEPRNVNRRWDELRERGGLHWLRLHDLRHGCATFMLAAGVPARTIMDVLGHSEIGVTMNTYTHILMQLRETPPTQSTVCSAGEPGPLAAGLATVKPSAGEAEGR